MSKKTKVWLIIASSLVLVGCMIFGCAMTMLKWDFKKLSTVKYETNDYLIDEEYTSISIVSKTADIVFVPSENSETKVVCYEESNVKHSVTVNDGSLVIEVSDNRKWYEYIGINFDNAKITVYIPHGEYGALSVRSSTSDVKIPEGFKFESIDISVSTGDVSNCASASEHIKIKTSTGDIRLENVSAEALDLSVTTGEVIAKSISTEGDIKIKVGTGDTKLTDVVCESFASTGSTGDISLKNVIAAEELYIKRSTGDVKLDCSDAAELFIKTDTGDVKGSLLTDKVFITKTDTGSVNVPDSITGGRCEITTDTGDIRIRIQQKFFDI